MGKQYKTLKEKDIEFIRQQKLFYIASASVGEVNLSPKGYDSIRVLSEDTLVFLDYPGSGNRSYRDTKSDGEFTLLFNAFEGKAVILRLFCKAEVIDKRSEDFQQYLKMFDEKESLVRNIFLLKVYGVETSCGDSVPYMEYKGERDSLKKWAVKMDENGRLDQYIEDHLIPPRMKNL